MAGAQKRRKDSGVSKDSHAFDSRESLFQKSIKRPYLQLGSVVLPQPEPFYRSHSAVVELERGGVMLNTGWPGPNVALNPAGLPLPVSIGFHGLFDPPMPGHKVVVGFIDGNNTDPVVVAKLPSPSGNRIELEGSFTLPMTQKLVGPTDVALGSYTGSYIAIRGILPIPGQIDFLSLTTINANALAAILMQAGGAMTLGAGGAVNVAAGGAMNLAAGAALNITAGAAMAITGLSILIQSGAPVLVSAPFMIMQASLNRPSAHLGDFAATALGPAPIAGTGRFLS